MVAIVCLPLWLLIIHGSDFFSQEKQMKTRNTGILEGWNNGLKQKHKTKNPFFFSTFSFFLFFPSIQIFQALLFSQHSNIPSFHHSNVISLPNIPIFHYSNVSLLSLVYPHEMWKTCGIGFSLPCAVLNQPLCL
jgi:hypothetical protein